MAGEIRGAFGALPGMSGGPSANGLRIGSPQPEASGPVAGRIDGDGLAEPERGAQPTVALACPATVAATRTAVGVVVGLILTLAGAAAYVASLSREARTVAQAHDSRIDANRRTISRLEREIRELQSRAGR